MRDLRLIGVQEDGQHLLLSDADGERFRVQLDEPLRAAARRDRPRLGQLQIEIDGGMRPREVQALIRGGLSAEEVAERSGWPVEKVRRYEGPILAEREYVAGLARAVRLRGRSAGGASTPTLSARVSQRLSGRGVDPATAEWDSARGTEGDWTVIVTFAAGGRERQARWSFDVQARTVAAADDEARWLSEEDAVGTSSPLPAPHLVSAPVRSTTVYDVEAEGGVGSARRAAPRATGASSGSGEEPLDLMSAMRERASHRGRPRRRKSPPTQTPGDEAPREDALPLERLAYDPESMPPPPAARGQHPLDDGLDDDLDVDRPDDRGSNTEPPTDHPQDQHDDDQHDDDQHDDDRHDDDPHDDHHDDQNDDHHDVLPAAPASADDLAEARRAPEDADDASDRPDGEREPTAARPAAKKSGRRSVPSWDDVMFGARPRD
ncbi:Protein of unknown function [Pedococcus dokdonensis]|uniref:DUF3071 domain-containing protein n=1 Tax=Pedococcus dokdonensis TaxID=443156 RepID=A0A1H0N130_9MICO|nr:septation protein SepH [Pedococcus dokdonensis]SDO86408.1 Protein of unknown function [Pedococcus dokdonensis]